MTYVVPVSWKHHDGGHPHAGIQQPIWRPKRAVHKTIKLISNCFASFSGLGGGVVSLNKDPVVTHFLLADSRLQTRPMLLNFFMPGTLFESPVKQAHLLSCATTEGCLPALGLLLSLSLVFIVYPARLNPVRLLVLSTRLCRCYPLVIFSFTSSLQYCLHY